MGCLGENTSTLALVVISRAPIGIAQLSSPTEIPPWVPSIGGTVVAVHIGDLRSQALVPLNAPEVRIGEICEALFRCETAVTSRLRATHAVDHRLSNSLLDLIRVKEGQPGSKQEGFEDILIKADAGQSGVTERRGFRPSAGERVFIVGRLMRVVSASNVDELSSRGKALAQALGLGSDDAGKVHESLPCVLLRPTVRAKDAATRFGRSILLTLYSSCQLVTAAAHADDYPRYPLLALQGLSFDLRTALAEIEGSLRLAITTDLAGRSDTDAT
jgi:hypothetical protein